MLVWKRSLAGTIREENQDVLKVNEERGVVILADGRGSAGRELAELAASKWEKSIYFIQSRFDAQRANQELKTLLPTILSEIRELRANQTRFATCDVDFAVAFIVEGHILACRTGTCGALFRIGSAMHRLEPCGLLKLAFAEENSSVVAPLHSELFTDESAILGPFKLKVGDWILFFSQGLLVSQPLEEILPVTSGLNEDPEKIAEALYVRASQRYDGDDRTMTLARILPVDLKSRIPKEIVVDIDFDRRFKMPLWAPLSALLTICIFFVIFVLRFLVRKD